MTERSHIDAGELEKATGLTPQDLIRIGERAAGVGVPLVEDVGMFGQGLYYAGRLFRGGLNLTERAIGSILVIPRAEETVVLTRRNLTGDTSFLLGRGLRRYSETDIDRNPDLVRPGGWVIKIPFLESPNFVNVVTLQEFMGIPKIRPELSGIVADLKISQVHGFARFTNPVTTITNWRSQKRALRELGDSILNVAAGCAFNNDLFFAGAEQIAQVLSSQQPEKLAKTEEEKEKLRAVIASSTRLVTASLQGFLKEAARAQAGLTIEEVAVEVGYPEELREAVQAGVEAEALRVIGGAEAEVLRLKTGAITDAVGEVAEALLVSFLERQT